MEGPGKYDDVATLVRQATDAQGVVVLVINGARGVGFSVQGTRGALLLIPDMLAHVIAEMKKDGFP